MRKLKRGADKFTTMPNCFVCFSYGTLRRTNARRHCKAMTTMSAEFALSPVGITLCLALVIRRSKCGKLLQGIVLKPITGIGIGFEWFEFFLLSVETQVIINF